MDAPSEVRLAGPAAVATYKKALPYGERFAVMCALQQAPGTKGTDRAFMEGRMNNQQLDAMPERQARYIAREAREAGISIEGKYYCGGIADKRGWRDPSAWVSCNDDILKVAKRRRMTVSGTVNYDPGVAPPKRKKINERIVNEEVARIKRNNPHVNVGEVRERIIEKHSYKAKGR